MTIKIPTMIAAFNSAPSTKTWYGTRPAKRSPFRKIRKYVPSPIQYKRILRRSALGESTVASWVFLLSESTSDLIVYYQNKYGISLRATRGTLGLCDVVNVLYHVCQIWARRVFCGEPHTQRSSCDPLYLRGCRCCVYVALSG